MRVFVFILLVLVIAGVFMYVRVKNFINNLDYDFTIDKITGLGIDDLIGIGTAGSNADVFYTMTLINNSSFGMSFKSVHGEFYFNGNIIGTTDLKGPLVIHKDAVTELKGFATVFMTKDTKDLVLGTTSKASSIPIQYRFMVNWMGLRFPVTGTYDIAEYI